MNVSERAEPAAIYRAMASFAFCLFYILQAHNIRYIHFTYVILHRVHHCQDAQPLALCNKVTMSAFWIRTYGAATGLLYLCLKLGYVDMSQAVWENSKSVAYSYSRFPL